MFKWLKTARRVEDLEQTVEKLERQMKMLALDWDQTYEKLKRMSAKLAKREEREETANLPAQEGGEGQSEENGVKISSGSGGLSPHQTAIQQKILAHRNRIKNGVM